MPFKNKIALLLIAGYFGSIVVIWLSYAFGVVQKDGSLDAIKSISQYGSGILGVIVGYYFRREGGGDGDS
ncbi:hypothetical protein FAZ69_30215 [Trinickia terrae]|uniref:Uncharacterized protein n=1 Tax=Trinickia terrae TaxID=2571161 RepID=A0A4U1HFS7_9BURK|nr:hypothetical protein [Trinickia terrae]TKC79885.1 hypothetical protein FAZ69_30215 [Trinickia terrae]